MLSREEAKSLVDAIGAEHGHVRQEILDALPDALRTELAERLRALEELAGSAVKTLAQNLYDSSARFVFELLQNADDNHYEHANEAPYVAFRIYDRRIVVECNEDGFTPENLRAICNVGKSSKKAAVHGYIGEKGIGFKSIFMVADKVHIQSGNFSFYFQHRKGEPGMGMITPIWEDSGEAISDKLTRITLYLPDCSDAASLEERRAAIRQQFTAIHDEILLFMKNLRKIEVAFFDAEEDSMPESTITFTVDRPANNRVVAKKTTFEKGETEEDLRYYHITKHVAGNLAKNDNRTYSETEESSGMYSESEITLAFPLTSDSVPLLERQWVFAFLPVQQMGFNFIIQADFVTQANRQGIVTSSPRNKGLVEGAADAFIKAVLQLCDHDTLQYQWMRYLPSKDSYPWDDFWSGLISAIGDKVRSTPVMRPANPSLPLRLIGDVFHQSDVDIDQYSRPLFPDMAPEIYLSAQYSRNDLYLLRDYGLRVITMERIIDRARHDLDRQYSTMKSTNDQDWHSRAAKCLQFPFTNNWPLREQQVKELKILPLRDGRWVSILAGPVYYPQVDGANLDIPIDLELDVLSPVAVGNADRKKLFDTLGVQTASVRFIMKTIKERYDSSSNVSLADSVGHCKFLYLAEAGERMAYQCVYLRGYSHRGRLEPLPYFRDDEPYGAADLFSPTAPGPHPGDGAPGYDVPFINDAYFEDPPNPPSRGSVPWKEALREVLDVRRHPPVIASDEENLTEQADYVARHRPEKFLGFLHKAWKHDQDIYQLHQSGPFFRRLSEIGVLCKGDAAGRYPLASTYLPLKPLQDLHRRFMLDDEFFPWLQLEGPQSFETLTPEWEALAKAVGLGFKEEHLTFVLNLLTHIEKANPCAELRQPERVYQLYNYLQAKVRESTNKDGCTNKIRKFFTSTGAIFIPEGDIMQACWALPEECVWEASIELTTKYSLEKLYGDCFPSFEEDKAHLTEFFHGTLDIPNCGWKDIVEEIKGLKSSDSDIDRAKSLYKYLHDMNLTGAAVSELKTAFEADALICGGDADNALWYKTSQCLWSTKKSSATHIGATVILNNLYGVDLRAFFVTTVGIQSMTAELVYRELSSSRRSQLSVEQAKFNISTFSSLMQDEKQYFDPEPVLKNQVFPIRLPDGTEELRKGTQDFALVDQMPLYRDFEEKAIFLHFSMDEIGRLQPFISWARLEGRYLSRAVRETSAAHVGMTRRITSPHRDIRCKAHALLRVAAMFDSPLIKINGLERLYTLLRNSQTLETDEITSELLLSQDGAESRVEKAAALLHIDDSQDGLKIYVPRDRASQDACFLGKLPRRFCEWLMTDPTSHTSNKVDDKAVNAVQSVLNADPTSLLVILDLLGISTIDLPDLESEELARENRSHEPSTPPRAPHQADISRQVPQNWTPDEDEPSTSSDSDSLDTDTPPSSTYASSPAGAGRHEVSYITARSRLAAPSRPRIHRTGPQVVRNTDAYTTLLCDVVDAARQATFPSRGTFDMSALQAALVSDTSQAENDEDWYRLDSTNRDKQIGAAGELFVFELLSRMGAELPGFSRDNWKSTIRKFATSHPEYTDMEPWNGQETADITYDDTSGALTSLLVDKGYLAADVWRGVAGVSYFLEVKTTTGPCHWPFYMSKSQYSRMQATSSHNSGGRATNSVYVIMRVYNLGKDSIAFRVLVDPEGMRQRGELAFAVQTWSVVSGA